MNKDTMLNEIRQYWTNRAQSYSDIVAYELSHANEENWMNVIEEHLPKSKIRNKKLKILDIGTGPGFFAIGLARRNYEVTAVDYTPGMLEKARMNAKNMADKIQFACMDAHKLDFPDESFDVIVTRNLTWNLECPQDAYAEWYRVLKHDGILLNFDAGWYNYLFDEEQKHAYESARETVADSQKFDFESYDEGYIMEEISRKLILSKCIRPQADIQMLMQAGYTSVFADTKVWERTWDETEKLNFSSTPLFLISAVK